MTFNQYFFAVLFILYTTLVFSQKPVDYADPFIGTTNYGATNPGAIVPWGMVSVVPFNAAGKQNKLDKDSQWFSTPYEYNNTYFTGFSHVNLSGVGCPDLGSLLLMPTTGELITDHKIYGSSFSDQKASPGYYSAEIDRYNILSEVTATQRTGLSRFTFPSGESNILLNLGLGLTNETGGMIKINSSTEVEGFRMVGDFCYNAGGSRPVYFVMKVNKKPKELGVWKKNPYLGKAESGWSGYSDKVRVYKDFHQSIAGDSIGVYLKFDTEQEENIQVKVGVSYVSIENARMNLMEEQPGWDFDRVKSQARKNWNEQLSKIVVEGETEDDKIKFYTALYHVLIHPNVFQDVNGEYMEMEGYNVLKTEGRDRYTVFSLWDTYRTVHPLLSLVYPKKQSDMVKSMLDMYRESGWLPKWELLSKETKTMVGDPAVPVIADTWLRGIRDFDIDLAYEAMYKSATQLQNNKLRPGLDIYIDKGYIPVGYDGVWGSLSTTQEYNISDWSLAQIAKALDKKDDYSMFYKRSLSYKKFYDKESKILRPLAEDGSWHEPFDPTFGKNFEAVPGYVEGTAWQYTFFVPHDIPGLIKLYGGRKSFSEQLHRAFDEDEFSMHNEPDIAYPYLFNYLKGEEKYTQKTVRECIEKYFTTTPGGIPGNDDTGTLSAWLVFSMMGIYPDSPAKMDYALTTPVFDKVTIELDNEYYKGSEISIEKSGEDIYFREVLWNGKKHKDFFFSHEKLVEGGTLQFITK